MNAGHRGIRRLVGAAIGGAAGLVAMRLYWQGTRAVTGEDPRSRTRRDDGPLDDISVPERATAQDESSTAAVGRMADEALTGDPPRSPRKRRRLSTGVHWGFGLSMAATYALLRGRVPPPDLLGGLAFGAAVWAAADELLVPLLGLSRGPTAYPLGQHVHRLGAHLAYGLATSSATQLAGRMLDRPRSRRERVVDAVLKWRKR